MKKDGRANNGGARKGSGAKPKADKKVQVIFYFRKSELELFGGKYTFMEFVNRQVKGSLLNLLDKS